MAKYRISQLLSNEAADTPKTKIVNINGVDNISRIVIETKATNNGSTPTAHGAKVISKIELVDGSDVLHSLSGIQSQALTFEARDELPFMVNDFRNDVLNIQTFELNFGRFLYDAELALDPKRFKNLQLKITHNLANGGSAPDALNLRVFAHEFDEKKVSPRGFLMAKEFFTYSLTSNAVQRVDLPIDHSYRTLMVQSLAGGKQPWEQFNKLTLSTNSGKKLVLNNELTSDLLKLFAPSDRIVETFLGTGTGSDVDHFPTVTYDAYGVISNLDAALTNNFVPQDYGGTQAISGDNAEHFNVLMSGLAPHGALGIRLWDRNKIEDFFAANSKSDVRLDITAGSAVGSSSTCEIVIEQLRMY